MNNFCDGHYFQNYHKFKDTRTILDAVVLTNYLQWNNKCTKFFEIGVNKGANFAIAIEAKDSMECVLVDPDLTSFNVCVPIELRTRATCMEIYSRDIDYSKLPCMDFISLDGDPTHPTPTDDLKNLMSITHEQSVIQLSWVNHPDTKYSREFLKKANWTKWIELDGSEFWAKCSLQDFINNLIENKSGLLDFSTIIKGNDKDDYKWKLTTPKFVYEHVELLRDYIK